jgi:transposase-like protein
VLEAEGRCAIDPQTTFCPNLACPARGQIGQGNIRVHSQKQQRYRYLVCSKTFSARAGTPFFRRRTDEQTITRVLTLVAYGCPIPAIEAAFALQAQTVRDLRAPMPLAQYYSGSSLRQSACLAHCPRTLAGTPDVCALSAAPPAAEEAA